MPADSSRLSLLFAPFGSQGDVRPLIWFAAGMAARGHDITFLITPTYKNLVEGRGWRVWFQGSEALDQELMQNPDLWRPMKGTELVLNHMLTTIPTVYETIDSQGRRFDLAITSSIGVAVTTWAEKNRVPRLITHLQPMCVRSVGDSPILVENWEWLTTAPVFIKRSFFWLTDRILGAKLLKPINAFRATKGMKPLTSINDEVWQGADGVAALFPLWFAPPQPDWPRHLRQFSFPIDPAEATSGPPLSPELEAFLAAGKPPVLWTHGSANLDTTKFHQVAREASRALNVRCLIVGLQTPGESNPQKDYLHVPFAPFGSLVPRCKAIVHHGGIGTCAQALAAGIPQLIVPRSHDQPDNGRRLERLGVGARLSYRDLSVDTAAAKLRTLIGNPSTATTCADYRKKILSDNPLPALCEWAEVIAAQFNLNAKLKS